MRSDELEKLLAELRSGTRHVEAPAHVELALRNAFRAQAKVPARRRWPRGALAAAAVVSVLIGAAAWKIGQPVATLPDLRLALPAAPPMVLPARQPEPAPPLVAKRIKRTARPRVAPARVEPHPPEVATDFLPIEGSANLAPIESGQIVRVQLPRSSMMRFGLPVNQDRMMEPVKADVVFAQDGIARAIRFVR